jgi:LysR family transcriptional regulator for metE and metH
VFDYEQVLVVPSSHQLASASFLLPQDLQDQVLLTYPVAKDRLDIYTHFLNPASVLPKQNKAIETTDIMLQMVANGRGVAALPRWLAQEYCARLPLSTVRLGETGIAKQIFLGVRQSDNGIDYLRSFLQLARDHSPKS